MELSSGRLEASSRIQERPFGHSPEEDRRRLPRRRKEPAADGEVMEHEEGESHQLDDMA
ncbi:MAG TPA: hypothetical protein VL240_01420 [Candidatus Binatia bacterium]|nr:hypothetical protein [Candidatus Binatia bacterium]